MKRVISLFLTMLTILMVLPITALGVEEAQETEDIIWTDDGGYIVITTQSAQTRASGTRTESRMGTYYDSKDNVEWRITLTATFTYNGTTSSCTAASCDVTIYDSMWYLISKSVTKSGNTATATVTLGFKVLGVTVSKPTYTLSLSCDKDGNMS